MSDVDLRKLSQCSIRRFPEACPIKICKKRYTAYRRYFINVTSSLHWIFSAAPGFDAWPVSISQHSYFTSLYLQHPSSHQYQIWV